MPDNLYAPPKANVIDTPDGREAPALWNPGAASSLSLFFTPAFGAWLHWQNWKALGDERRAEASHKWFIASIVVGLGSVLIAMFMRDLDTASLVLRMVNFAFLLTWYFSSAKPQIAYVKARFSTYPRRGWLLPILSGIGILCAYVAVGVVMGLVHEARSGTR